MLRMLADYPPNYAEIASAFDLSGQRPIFCYGDALYNPHGIEIDRTLFAHEGVHWIQQEAAGGPAIWWDRYLADAAFRLSQEAEAYGAQLRAFGLWRDREKRHRFCMTLAQQLASPVYGSPCTATEAYRMIGKASR